MRVVTSGSDPRVVPVFSSSVFPGSTGKYGGAWSGSTGCPFLSRTFTKNVKKKCNSTGELTGLVVLLAVFFLLKI